MHGLRAAAASRAYDVRTPLLLLLGAIVLLLLALTILPKKFDRYALPAVPLLQILAACGLVWLGSWAAAAAPAHGCGHSGKRHGWDAAQLSSLLSGLLQPCHWWQRPRR
ncbi:MAG: hypothetical protein HC837_16730 [Chloroflexaceae bacterium]|nr:hypothetical protein [Chloroflexaceae bacterium]